MHAPAHIETNVDAQSLVAFVSQTTTSDFLLVALLTHLAERELAGSRWRLMAVKQEETITAAAALHVEDGYCLVHGIDDDDLRHLAVHLDEHHFVSRLAGEEEMIDAVLEVPSLARRIGRDEREYFMILPPFEQKVQPDGNYRPAAVSDIPVLRAYAAGYSAEHNVPFICDWHQAVANRQVLVAESRSPHSPGQIAACLMRGVHTRDFVLCSGVYTFPAFRGQGYATRLVANYCFEASLVNLGTCLYVGIHNRPALKAYERVGFRQAGRFRTVFLRHPGLVAKTSSP